MYPAYGSDWFAAPVGDWQLAKQIEAAQMLAALNTERVRMASPFANPIVAKEQRDAETSYPPRESATRWQCRIVNFDDVRVTS